MNIHFIVLLLLFVFWQNLFAESSKAINNQASINANPAIELYSGQSEELTQLMEKIQLEKIERLLDILYKLKNGENDKAIKFLEEDLMKEVKIIEDKKSEDAQDIMRQVEKYYGSLK